MRVLEVLTVLAGPLVAADGAQSPRVVQQHAAAESPLDLRPSVDGRGPLGIGSGDQAGQDAIRRGLHRDSEFARREESGPRVGHILRLTGRER